ncbi:hypothetical protein Chor_007778 [Crotalus horridus]
MSEGGTVGFAFPASCPRFAVAGEWPSHEKQLPPADAEAMAWAASSLPSDKSRCPFMPTLQMLMHFGSLFSLDIPLVGGNAALVTYDGSRSGSSPPLSILISCLRFICIYPAYINNKKTIAEGRRIPLDKAIENPTSTEIQDVCAAVGLNVLLEKNKMYPREWNRDAQYRGRVRIQLKQEDGHLCQPQFPTRKAVMLYAAETIPKLKTRTQKMGGSDLSLQQGEGGKKNKGKKKK